MSSNPLNFAKVDEAMKEHYHTLRVRNMVYKNNPFLGLVNKYRGFGGKSMPVPLRYHDPQRRSATFSTAQGNTSTSGLKQFTVERVQDYSFAYIDGETIQASRGDNNAFLQYLTMEIDGAMNSLVRSLAISLYRDGHGSIGTVGAKTAGTASDTGSEPGNSTHDVLTLSNAEDITNFEVGMDIVSAASVSGSPTATARVIAIDRAAGKLTLDATPDNATDGYDGAASAISVGHLLFQAGDFTAASDRKKISGLDAWLPKVAPVSGDSFMGVDRSADSTRLAGVRFDGSAMPIEEALMEAVAAVARDGGSPDVALCDFKTYVSLEKSLGSRVRYNSISAPDVDVGFAGIQLVGPSGTVNVIPDLNCVPDTVFLLQMDTWQLASLNECPQFLDADDNRILRDAGADAYECRLGYYAQLVCFAPGYNCRLSLA